MKITQELKLEDYHLFLKETLYANVIFKMIVATGFLLLLLVIYKFVNNNFVYTQSMNGLLLITALVLFIRKITHIGDKRRFNRNDYINQLTQRHYISFDDQGIKIVKGKDKYEMDLSNHIEFAQFPTFLVLTLSQRNKFPIKITEENVDTVKSLLTYIENHNSKFESA